MAVGRHDEDVRARALAGHRVAAVRGAGGPRDLAAALVDQGQRRAGDVAAVLTADVAGHRHATRADGNVELGVGDGVRDRQRTRHGLVVAVAVAQRVLPAADQGRLAVELAHRLDDLGRLVRVVVRLEQRLAALHGRRGRGRVGQRDLLHEQQHDRGQQGHPAGDVEHRGDRLGEADQHRRLDRLRQVLDAAGVARTGCRCSAPAPAGSLPPNAFVMLGSRVLNRTVRKIATPAVPPIWRKNVADAVETPMSLRGPAFCTAMISVCMHWPRPRPMMAAATSGCHSGESYLTCAKKNAPTGDHDRADDREDLVAPGPRR